MCFVYDATFKSIVVIQEDEHKRDASFRKFTPSSVEALNHFALNKTSMQVHDAADVTTLYYQSMAE